MEPSNDSLGWVSRYPDTLHSLSVKHTGFMISCSCVHPIEIVQIIINFVYVVFPSNSLPELLPLLANLKLN